MFQKVFVAVAAALLAQTASFAQAQTVNIPYDSVLADMTAKSEAIVINPKYDWQYKGVINQYAPSGTILPSWWPGTRPLWCYSSLTWYTAFEAQGNAAVNTRIQVRNLRMYILSERTRKWSLVDTSTAPYTGLWKYPFVEAGDQTKAGVRKETTGGYSIKPVYPHFHHGYGNPKPLAEPADVRAVYIAMDFRLVVDDPKKPDDRAKARYVVNAGGDYYPGKGQTWGVNYAPGIGGGRYLLATTQWRTANMLAPNKRLGSSFTELRNIAPPLTAQY